MSPLSRPPPPAGGSLIRHPTTPSPSVIQQPLRPCTAHHPTQNDSAAQTPRAVPSDILNGHKTVVLDQVPTAENLARIAFDRLDAVYRDTYGNHLQLERVRLYETPNCWADAVRGS